MNQTRMEALHRALDDLQTEDQRWEDPGNTLPRTPPTNCYPDRVGEEQFILPTQMDAVNDWLERASSPNQSTGTTTPLSQVNLGEEESSGTSSSYSTTSSEEGNSTASSTTTATTTTREESEPGKRRTRKRNQVPQEFLYEEDEEWNQKERKMERRMEQKARRREIDKLNRTNKKRRRRELDRENTALKERWDQASARQREAKKAIRIMDVTISKLKRELETVEEKAKFCSGSNTVKQTGEMEKQLRALNKENKTLRQQRGQPDIHQKLYHNLERALHLECDQLPDCPQSRKKITKSSMEGEVTSSSRRRTKKPRTTRRTRTPKSKH